MRFRSDAEGVYEPQRLGDTEDLYDLVGLQADGPRRCASVPLWFVPFLCARYWRFFLRAYAPYASPVPSSSSDVGSGTAPTLAPRLTEPFDGMLNGNGEKV